MRRWRHLSNARVVGLWLVLGALGVLASPLGAADAPTAEAIRQAEEAKRAARLPSPYIWGQPGPWWIGCAPGQPCPLASFPPGQVPPYPGAPAPLPAPSQGPSLQSPMRVNPAGRLLILVNPVDAEVYLDGVRLQQQSDLSYEVGLLAGPHQLDVKKDGYKAYSQRVEILPGAGIYLPIALER